LKKIIILLIILFYSSACTNDEKLFTEPLKIELEGDVAERTIEASGLAWYKDNLIILPQFPHKWDNQFDGAIYFIPKARIESYVNGENRNPINAEKIYFVAEGLDEIGKRRGSGYEALIFIEDTIYLSIESINGEEPSSFIVKGNIDFIAKKIVLNSDLKFEIKSQTMIHNMGEESILEYQNNIYAIHEANGININMVPFATMLNNDLSLNEKVSMPNVDYRITDATSVDSTGKFYAINYFYPGEFNKLLPNLKEEDKDKAIEQILEFQIFDNKIARTDRNPYIISKSIDKNGHNWEGIVKLNNGFLLITDMFPKTILEYYR
jgi:hypothetical protein